MNEGRGTMGESRGTGKERGSTAMRSQREIVSQKLHAARTVVRGAIYL